MRLSVDDGCHSDVRLAELAQKYEIPTVFYWPVEWHSLAYENGYKPLTVPEAKEIAGSFEIGSHTITHRHLTILNDEDALDEIIGSKYLLEAMFHRPIFKFAPPRGYTNEHLTDMTLTVYESQRLTKGKGLVHIHPSSGANGNQHWFDRIEEMKAAGEEVVELWCHSWELDKYKEWENLEEYLDENLAR